MKILIIEPGGYAGTFQYTHCLADALAGLGMDVALATGVNFETKAFPHRYRPMEVFDRFVPRPLRLFRFFRYVHRWQPDIVHIQGHCHPGSYYVLWNILRRICRARFVYTAQDIVPKDKRPHHMMALRRIYPAMSHIFVNADQNRRMLLERFPRVDAARVTAIPLADLTAFVHDCPAVRPPELPAHARAVLYFGIIEPRKGLLSLIRAFPRIKERVPEAHLMIVGKPFEAMTRYTQAIRETGMESSITLRAEYLPLEQVSSVLTHCDVLALPYVQGWNSAVIATAYAFGKPVVASDIGGFREVITDGETGLLVPPGNVEALGDAVASILQDDALRMRMQHAIATEARLNSWSAIAGKTETIYRQVLEK